MADRQTESDAYELTMQNAQVGSINCYIRRKMGNLSTNEKTDCALKMLRLIVKLTYFQLRYVMGVIDGIVCAHLDKILKSRLHFISGLYKTHCQQVLEFHANC